jgi:hypothetical protein
MLNGIVMPTRYWEVTIGRCKRTAARRTLRPAECQSWIDGQQEVRVEGEVFGESRNQEISEQQRC